MMEQTTLDINLHVYTIHGDRMGMNESVKVGEMSFIQLSRLLLVFHIVMNAIKEGKPVNVNGQTFSLKEIE